MVRRLRALCERTEGGDQLIALLGRLDDAVEAVMAEHIAERAAARNGA
jgi:hypothetical protein